MCVGGTADPRRCLEGQVDGLAGSVVRIRSPVAVGVESTEMMPEGHGLTFEYWMHGPADTRHE
jgi:hypothetical protein